MGGQLKSNNSQRVRNEKMGFSVSHKPCKTVIFPHLPGFLLSMNTVCNIAGKEQQRRQHNKHYGYQTTATKQYNNCRKTLPSLVNGEDGDFEILFM